MPRFLFSCLLCLASAASAQNTPAPGLRDVVDPTRAAPRPTSPDAASQVPAPPAPAPDPMALLFKRVSQLMMVTLEGVNGPTTPDRQILRSLTPGAIILPRVTTAASTAAYVQTLRPLSATALESLPILIGVDLFAQEKFADDARVSELRVPMMLSLAAAGPSDATANLFGLMADNLHSMGFDFHLGPSLALSPTTGLGNADSLNSFGEDPLVGTGLARQFHDALKDRGIAWMPMGYPGGAGRPAILLTPRSQLRNRDLAPYEASINAGARLLNVGVALVPTIDGAATPACFSPIVINDLRKEVLGYQGLVVAGPMDALEIKALGKPEEAVVEALLAGADMFYWSAPGPGVTKAIAAVVDAVNKGGLDDAILERALTHVREYKKSLPAAQADKDVAKAAQKFERKQEKFTEPLAIERRAITLVRNDSNVLPLSEAASQPIAVIGVWGAEELQLALEEYIEPIAQRSLNNARQAPRIEDFELNRILKITDGYRTIICIFSGDLEASSQKKLIGSFRKLGKRIVAVVLGYPKDISTLNEADAVLITYGSTKRLNDTMSAVADILVGNAPVDILPPLRNLSLRTGEQVNFDANDVLRSPVGRLPVSFAPPYLAGYSVSYRPTLAVQKIHWDFGDGAKASTPVAAHAYEKPGEYTVKLTISGKKKETATSGEFRVKVQ